MFLPLLEDTENVAKVLSDVKKDLREIATDHLDKEFRDLLFFEITENLLH
jgi:hypothetical protein